MFDLIFTEIINELAEKAEELGFEISSEDIVFDDSRSWSIYIYGDVLGLPVGKFGAYRNYLGGGIRSGICTNGRKEENTLELAELFKEALEKIENIYNEGYEDAEEWEKPTGVLL